LSFIYFFRRLRSRRYCSSRSSRASSKRAMRRARASSRRIWSRDATISEPSSSSSFRNLIVFLKTFLWKKTLVLEAVVAKDAPNHFGDIAYRNIAICFRVVHKAVVFVVFVKRVNTLSLLNLWQRHQLWGFRYCRRLNGSLSRPRCHLVGQTWDRQAASGLTC